MSQSSWHAHIRLKRLPFPFAILLACSPLVSCTSGNNPSIATYESRGEGGDAALLTGVVKISSDCLYVEFDRELILPVFPKQESEFNNGALRIGRTEVSAGDKVQLTGSEKSRATLTDLAAEIPAACNESTRYWLVAATI